ncbi:hypothetical protein RIF29_30154 [Crotalaria pallida]|uniref:RING-type E3 ubiquitin transferase n=1 Tax=Crotalaria pallida TaxID=3830 RepID=A0AAN9EFT7_CROPI
MAPKAVQHPTFFKYGDSFLEEGKVYLSYVVASSTNNQVNFLPVSIPIWRSLFSHDNLCEDIVETFLRSLQIPQNFLNRGGGDDDDGNMVVNLSRMLSSAVLQPQLQQRGAHYCVAIMVSEGSCKYKVLNSSNSFNAEQFPSSECVRLACEVDEEDKCAMCLEGFKSLCDADMLPCFHVFHPRCIVKWFEQSVSCPVCRYVSSVMHRYYNHHGSVHLSDD